MPNLEEELRTIEIEMIKLRAQRDLLLRLLGRPVPAIRSKSVSRASSLDFRPRDPGLTQAILDEVAKQPGRSAIDVAKLLAGQGAGDREIARIYNTAYGLFRRGKLKRDERGNLFPADG